MKRYISLRKRKRFSDIQMILTLVVSIGLLAACPSSEEVEEVSPPNSDNLQSSGKSYFMENGEIYSNNIVQELR